MKRTRTTATITPREERVVRLDEELRELAMVLLEDEQTNAVVHDLAVAGLL
jgi:hypothetical protein